MSSHRLPTFLVIGPGRSGTSWIYEAFREHPEVRTAVGTKTTMFFDNEYHKGLDWYRRFFPVSETCTAYGEVSNSYIYSPICAQRIKKNLTDLTVITCLRNPIDRLVSAYLYRRRRGQLHDSLEMCLGKYPDLILSNYYWTSLRDYVHQPGLHLRIFLYDDLQQNPFQFVRRLYKSVGVDETFVPEVVDKIVNPSASARSYVHASVSNVTADSLRRVGAIRILDTLKRSELVRRVFLHTDADIHNEVILSEESILGLKALYRPEIIKVADLAERDLSHWME